jgi:acyl-CoA hydrolase
MPRPLGNRGIPWQEITAYCEAEQALLGAPESTPDHVSRAIARQLEPFIGDGATLQTGLGKVPDAVLDLLHDRRALRVYSGLIGDGVARLASAGALAGRGSVVAGTAIGSEGLYAAIEQDFFDFQPVSVTHDIRRIGDRNCFIALNSALSVDLFGQAYSEVTPNGAMSGPGGAIEYAQGAKLSRDGLSVVALPSTAKGGQLSRIIAPVEAAGPVALNRLLIDLVVTEHGVADFRGATHDERAEQLVAIAAPQFRSDLAQSWAGIKRAL